MSVLSPPCVVIGGVDVACVVAPPFSICLIFLLVDAGDK